MYDSAIGTNHRPDEEGIEIGTNIGYAFAGAARTNHRPDEEGIEICEYDNTGSEDNPLERITDLMKKGLRLCVTSCGPCCRTRTTARLGQ